MRTSALWKCHSLRDTEGLSQIVKLWEGAVGWAGPQLWDLGCMLHGYVRCYLEKWAQTLSYFCSFLEV